ncbi:MAG: ABC transporter ATP-binding protein [Anaerolineae bacterium]|nr:ABC transporter ATP-binding protein [Anaerolineae bacterium]
MATAIEMLGIRKVFPGVVANDNIDFVVQEGEIHALVGENGAGKTTLMNVLYGLYHPDAGTIKIRGQSVRIRKNSDAIELGIGMVHQSFKLVPSFTVAENITLGAEPRKSIFIDRKAVLKSVAEISDRFGLKVDPHARIRDLPVGVQQRVEILKTLYRNADILILDEPTAVLTPQETDDLFGVIRSLVHGGKTVIFITHKLREVKEISDRVTVMRDGKVIGTKETKEVTIPEIAGMMVGREVLLSVKKKKATPGEVVLRVEDLRVRDDRNLMAVSGVSLEVRRGEIVGVAGVEGNGQRELVDAIIGLRQSLTGTISINDQDVTTSTIRDRRETGMACVPEDRYVRGLALSATIEENLVVTSYFKAPMSRGPLLDSKQIGDFANKAIETFSVRTTGKDVPASTLSGGNLQKVVVAREMSANPDLLIAAQPTRGLDIGSIEFVHQQIVNARDNGAAILLVSAELEEVMSLSDRILVLYEGRIVGSIDADHATERGLGLWMTGITDEQESEQQEAIHE